MKSKVDPRSLMIGAYYLLVNDGAWKKTAEERAMMTIACRDAEDIPRVRDAGNITTKNGIEVQVMHNGLLVKQGGYQGGWQSKVIGELKGVHEPQEEKAFYELLKRLPDDAVIVELGSWWAYYSMWVLKDKKNSKAICGEPDPENLKLARENAELNEFDIDKRITYFESAAGSEDGKIIKFDTEDKRTIKVPIRTVDSIYEEVKLPRIDILHLDIQGAELEALKGAEETIRSGKVRFVVISTHHYVISGNPLMHQKCLDFIKEHGGHVVTEHGILESCSGDGLIVASFSDVDRDFSVEVSHIKTSESLFREYEYDVNKLWQAHDSIVNYIKKSEAAYGKQVADLQTEIQKRDAELANLRAFVNEITPLKQHLKRQVKARLKNRSRKAS